MIEVYRGFIIDKLALFPEDALSTGNKSKYPKWSLLVQRELKGKLTSIHFSDLSFLISRHMSKTR